VVDSFVFTTTNKNMTEWLDKANFINKVRQVFQKYPEFQATPFDYDATIFDLILTVKDELIRAVLITLVCMALICLIFIPNLACVALAAITIGSICFCKFISFTESREALVNIKISALLHGQNYFSFFDVFWCRVMVILVQLLCIISGKAERKWT
jgi:hypothetical protein